MNNANMLKLADFIETLNPKRLQMEGWAMQDDDDIDAKALDPLKCGSIGCIAGWAVFLLANREAIDLRIARQKDQHVPAIEFEAAALLGLNESESRALFYGHTYGASWEAKPPSVAKTLRRIVEKGFTEDELE